MKYILILLINIFCGLLIAQPAERVDEFKEVVEHFFTQYYCSFPVTSKLRFVKKPDGYYVLKLRDYLEVIDEELYRKVGSKEYERLTIFKPLSQATPPDTYKEIDGEKVKIELDNAQEFFNNKYLLEEIKLYPFYGYKGFYNDVINEFPKLENPAAHSLYSVCRAYSYKTMNMVYSNYSNGLEEERFEFNRLEDKLNEDQLEQYFSLIKKEIEAYALLKNTYPKYLTKVGLSGVKYAHAIMDNYIRLLVFSDREQAAEILEEEMYSDSTVTEAKLILDSCPQNAVLFTWADHDTYPLYYIQAKENYRNDIILLNISLVHNQGYLLNGYHGPFNAPPLNSSLNKEYYQRSKIIMKSRDELADEYCPANEFLRLIQNNDNYLNFDSPIDYVRFINDGISMQLKHGVFGNGKKEINLSLNKNTYANFVAQLDILYSNQQNRSICFTKTCIEDGNLVWEKFLRTKEKILILNLTKN